MHPVAAAVAGEFSEEFAGNPAAGKLVENSALTKLEKDSVLEYLEKDPVTAGLAEKLAEKLAVIPLSRSS
mgnify:CR=1 FL=1